ncbi:DnaJ domain-containing protein [Paraphaeosphaeria minitans]|uniref:DnaJ domain-containing protein n=1 Tax=Paraphaeosphaeria minitans TaxID=565426 RepID=A0A9P6GF33_9PLEO|nr:DnaJ domain-containing protein [Paraphaeosphaeria minitans]
MDSVTTHYDTLGVTQAAEPAVIRAAYKALALVNHPDKTLHLPAEDRAARSALFRNLQEAFDVLSNSSSRNAYNRDLEQASHTKLRSHADPSATSRRHNTIRVTSREEKRNLKAKIEQDIAYIREQRAKRDLEDAQMDIAALKFMAQTYAEMAAEYNDDALGDGNLRTYCATQMQVYLAKMEKREHEHEDWLENMSRPKTPGTKPKRPPTSHNTRTAAPSPKPAGTTSAYNVRTATPMPKPAGTGSNTYNLRTVTPLPKPAAGTTSGANGFHNPTPRPAHYNSTTTSPATAPTRAEEKARKETIKQAELDAKAAAMRAEKKKYEAKLQEQARQEAARKAYARAKTGAPPVGQWGTGPHAYTEHTPPKTTTQDSNVAKSSEKKQCSTCGLHHASFAEFRKCTKERANQANDDSFFQSA